MRKPFSIEAANSGAKVVTRDGRPAEILKYDYVDYGEKKIVYCYKDEDGNSHAYLTHLDGLCYKGKEYDKDILIEEEMTYRPYANAEAMDAAVKEHGMFVKDLNERRFAILSYDEENVSIGIEHSGSYGTLLRFYKWIDGTTCGVQEGGEE